MIGLLLLCVPLLTIVSIVVLQNSDKAHKAAFIGSIIEFAVALWAFFVFQTHDSTLFEFDMAWAKSVGLSLHIGIDGLSLVLVLLTAVLFPIVIQSSFKHKYQRPKVFYTLILIMQLALMGVFISINTLLFYIFWELALLPIYFIVALWGGENRIAITLKFFIYTLLGSLLMLVAILYLFVQLPENLPFDITLLYTINLTFSQQLWVFLAFFVAFAIKIPIFPLHTWQPDTYTTAPIAGTMLLAGIMLKMGVYGLIRFVIPICPAIVIEYGKWVMLLAIIGVIYASVIAVQQKEMKRMLAYSSLAHVGLIAAAVFAYNTNSLQGAVIQMFSHGITVVALFLVADIIAHRSKTTNIAELGGIVHSAPRFAIFFMISMLGSIALPLTSGFVGEFLMLLGLYQYHWLSAIFAGLSVIFGAVYMLWLYQRVVFGETKANTQNFNDLTFNELIVAIVIISLIFVVGIYPKPLLQLTESVVNEIIKVY